eukprot:jgi/Galph1/1858/GphlegSOOS_G544.1
MSETRVMLPNILIVGTPGTGKTTLANKLSDATGLETIEVGKFAEEHNCFGDYDTEFECYEINEDQLLLNLRPTLEKGGYIVEYHEILTFPLEPLYDRLVARGYSGRKLEENLECEIMEVILDEAYSCFESSKVLTIPSNDEEDLEANVEKIRQFIQSKMEDMKK